MVETIRRVAALETFAVLRHSLRLRALRAQQAEPPYIPAFASVLLLVKVTNTGATTTIKECGLRVSRPHRSDVPVPGPIGWQIVICPCVVRRVVAP